MADQDDSFQSPDDPSSEFPNTSPLSRRSGLKLLVGGAIAWPTVVQARNQNAAKVGSSSAPYVRSQSAFEQLRACVPALSSTGAVGDGVTDDTDALQEVADYFSRIGGEWKLPVGVFRTSRPITIKGDLPQRILGSGKRAVYPGLFSPARGAGASVIMPVHNGRAAVNFIGSAAGKGDISFANLAIASLEAGKVPSAAFGWDTSPHFLRNFTFYDCSIHGFRSAFDIYSSGKGEKQVGVINIEKCTINRNLWIMRTLDGTIINALKFVDNEAGQNGYLPSQGGLSISAHSVDIFSNIMEGNRDPIHIFGSMRGVRAGGNYFEACVGDALIKLEGVSTFDIDITGSFDIDETKLNHRLLLTGGCGTGRVNGPYWPIGIHKVDLPALGTLPNLRVSPTVRSPFLRVDRLEGRSYAVAPDAIDRAAQPVRGSVRELNPQSGAPMLVELHETAPRAAWSSSYPLRGKSGEWVVASWLLKRSDSGPDPYISLLLNAAQGKGSRDFISYNHGQYWSEREWSLITVATLAEVNFSSVMINLFPYGTKPDGKKRSVFLRPYLYTVSDPNRIIPYIDNMTASMP